MNIIFSNGSRPAAAICPPVPAPEQIVRRRRHVPPLHHARHPATSSSRTTSDQSVRPDRSRRNTNCQSASGTETKKSKSATTPATGAHATVVPVVSVPPEDRQPCHHHRNRRIRYGRQLPRPPPGNAQRVRAVRRRPAAPPGQPPGLEPTRSSTPSTSTSPAPRGARLTAAPPRGSGHGYQPPRSSATPATRRTRWRQSRSARPSP